MLHARPLKEPQNGISPQRLTSGFFGGFFFGIFRGLQSEQFQSSGEPQSAILTIAKRKNGTQGNHSNSSNNCKNGNNTSNNSPNISFKDYRA